MGDPSVMQGLHPYFTTVEGLRKLRPSDGIMLFSFLFDSMADSCVVC